MYLVWTCLPERRDGLSFILDTLNTEKYPISKEEEAITPPDDRITQQVNCLFLCQEKLTLQIKMEFGNSQLKCIVWYNQHKLRANL